MKAYIPCSQKPGKPAEGRPESAGSCIYLPPTGTSLLQPSPAPVGEKPPRIGHLVQPLSPGLGGQVVQFSHSVVSNPLWPHRLQHTRPPCPSPTPGAYQTHVQWVGDAIQPSHPLSSPSPLVFNLSQHQGLFKWVSSSHRVAKVLEFQLHHQSFQWIFRTDFLVGSPCSPRDSQESSPTPQFKSIK